MTDGSVAGEPAPSAAPPALTPAASAPAAARPVPAFAAGGHALPVAALLFNAFVWGVSWWPLRQFESIGLHPLWATALIYSLSTGVLLLLHRSALGTVLRTPALWVIVVAAGTTNACFNWGVTAGEVVRVVLLFYLMPLWSLLLARLLLGEPLTRGAVLRVGLAIAGAALVLTGGPPGTVDGAAAVRPQTWVGDVCGVVGGMTFALNNVMLRRVAALPTPARSLAMFIGGVAVAAVAALILPGSLEALGRAAAAGIGWWIAALVLGLLIIGSNLTLQYGAARLPARVTSLVMLSEVVFAAVSSMWIGGERFGTQVAIGAALVLSAAVLSTLERREPAAAG